MKTKNLKIVFAASLLAAVLVACGDGGKLPNDGLFGKLPNKYDAWDGNENFTELAANLYEGKTIPVEVDSDVPLTVEPMHFDTSLLLGGNYGSMVKFVGEATTKRAGVYDASTVWGEPKTDDEAYDFYWRIRMMMYDKEGKPVYVPDFLVTGLQKSGLQRVMNAQGTACNYSLEFSFSPVNKERIAQVAKIVLFDTKGPRAEEYEKFRNEQEQAEKDYRRSIGKEY